MLVYATMFMCNGLYTQEALFRWQGQFRGVRTAVLLVGECRINAGESRVHRVAYPMPVLGLNPRYTHMRAKFDLWRLPYDRVVYYDIDVSVKAPVDRCNKLCIEPFCAVRDPVATWPVKSKTYFNAGFMVLTPSDDVYRELIEAPGHPGDKFGDQDILNRVFRRWQKLPARCNWLYYNENRPAALVDNAVFAVHKPWKTHRGM